jgi:sulfatase modifying factor 1
MTASRLLLMLAALLFFAPLSRGQFVNYELVSVGNSGNLNDSTGYGGVPYEYRIGKYEVTIGQYTAFLNAVAKDDPTGLYNFNMSSDQRVAGIAQSGSSGAYVYSVTGPYGAVQIPQATAANRPITFISWFDAARFANWMSNGQPTGPQGATTTENGAYDLSTWLSGTAPAMNAINPNTGSTPVYRIPTESEWYKAAYYAAGGTNSGYWSYAMQSSTTPGNIPGGGANQANYLTFAYAVTQSVNAVYNQNYLTDVGLFTAGGSAYGTFDQSGNAQEWNDLGGTAGSSRGLRGGHWNGNAFALSSAARFTDVPWYGDQVYGFRLSSPVAVPEPSTYCMALAGLACGGYSVFRRRKRA